MFQKERSAQKSIGYVVFGAYPFEMFKWPFLYVSWTRKCKQPTEIFQPLHCGVELSYFTILPKPKKPKVSEYSY